MNSCELKELQQYLTDVEDKAVGITEYGKVTTPGVSTEDAGMLDLTPLALRKDQGYLKDEHWKNPRESNFLTSKITMPRKNGSSMELDLAKHDKRFHPGGWKPGQACKFRDEMNKKFAEAQQKTQKADKSDEIQAYLGGKTPKTPKIDQKALESNLIDGLTSAFSREDSPEVYDLQVNGNEFVATVGITKPYKHEPLESDDSVADGIAGQLGESSEVSAEELVDERTVDEPEPRTADFESAPGSKGYVYLVKGKLSDDDMKFLGRKAV